MGVENNEFYSMLQLIKEIYEYKIPFHRILGLKIVSLAENDVCIRIEKKEDLLGNYEFEMLHGGVISTVLDATCGLILYLNIAKRTIGQPAHEIKKRLLKVSTIDLRVDYLRPGQGNYFLSKANALRIGNKIAVVQSSLYNDKDLVVAVGTGTYTLI